MTPDEMRHALVRASTSLANSAAFQAEVEFAARLVEHRRRISSIITREDSALIREAISVAYTVRDMQAEAEQKA